MSIRKAYVDGPFGQIHLRIAGEPSENPDLICLHPAPFSSLAFTEIMPHLAKGRRVIAPDYPGHGGSDAFKADAQISEYAEAMLSLIETLSPNAPVDLFGFHTGCVVAVELALISPQSVRRMVLFDVPAFAPELRTEMLESNGAPPDLTPELASIASAWERGITRRIASQPFDRCFEMFAEQLRHGSAMNGAFHAGFSYPLEERFAALERPATVIASQSALLDATRHAATLFPQATLVERLDITRAVLDEAAPVTAAAVLEAL